MLGPRRTALGPRPTPQRGPGPSALTLRSFWGTFSLGNTSLTTIARRRALFYLNVVWLLGSIRLTIKICIGRDPISGGRVVIVGYSPILRDIRARARANYYKLYQKASESLTREEARPSPSNQLTTTNNLALCDRVSSYFKCSRKSSVAVF